MKGKFVLDPLMGLNMYLEKMLKSLASRNPFFWSSIQWNTQSAQINLLSLVLKHN